MSEWINTSKERLEKLEAYVDAIIEGKDVREIFFRYEETIKHITPFDVFNLRHFQTGSALSIDQIKGIAGKVMKSFNHGLSRYPWPHMNTSPFMAYLLEEMQAFKLVLDQIRPLLRKEQIVLHYPAIKTHIASLSAFTLHAHKMQYVLFPLLEQRMDNTLPLKVLWSVQDDVMKVQAKLLVALNKEDKDEVVRLIGLLYYTLFGLFEKEELLVLPIASRLLTKEDWDRVLRQSLAYGFAFRDKPIILDSIAPESQPSPSDALFQSATGNLTHEQLTLVLNHLGIDFTLVDHEDRVAYFNNPKDRFFPRSEGIVGRHVSDCHPPESVHVVEEILKAFKANTQSTASFWLTHKGKDIVIQYYALRDTEGNYKGVLEVSQDVTQIKRLTGERRLLAWENNPFEQ